MAREPQQQPDQDITPPHRTEIERTSDEESGGGGSATGTRYRGVTGGHPGGPLDEEDQPITRPDPESL